MSESPWKKTTLGETLTLQRGFDLPQRHRQQGSVPIVSSSGVSGFHNQPIVKGPGIVTGRYGTIGEVFYIRENFWPLNTTLYVRDHKRNDIQFLFYLLRTVDFKTHSGKSGVPGVNRNDLHKIEVMVPPIEEQRAIATVLSDVDDLIAALDKLIAKKRAIKQATMQQLLTGETRLPGFREEWSRIKIEDVAEIVSGGTPSTQIAEYWNGTIPWCTPTDITRTEGKFLFGTERMISKSGLMASSARLLPIGTLLLCSRATIGEVKLAAIPVATNQGFKSLVAKSLANNEYLYYAISTMKQRMIERAIGSTFLEISTKDLGMLEILLPPLSEQEAIASVLSDVDAEIVALEARRDKTRVIKQGMMQQLLTGRIRLVDPEQAP